MRSNKYLSPFPCPLCAGCECLHFLGWTCDGKLLVTAYGDQLPGYIPPGSITVGTGVSIRVYHPDGRAVLGDLCLPGGLPRRESGGRAEL